MVLASMPGLKVVWLDVGLDTIARKTWGISRLGVSKE